MLEQSVLISAENYLSAVKEAGIPVSFAVVYGSQAKGTWNEWSDIDLLVVSPHFDEMTGRADINLLWRLAAAVDSRIEPLPCGLKQWENDKLSAIIEIARREGEILTAA